MFFTQELFFGPNIIWVDLGFCSVRQLRLQKGVTRLLLLERRAASEGSVVEVEKLPKPIQMLLVREESKDLAPVNGLSINWEVNITI